MVRRRGLVLGLKPPCQEISRASPCGSASVQVQVEGSERWRGHRVMWRKEKPA